MNVPRWLGRTLGVATVRALRGAITVAFDAPEEISSAVCELIDELRHENALRDDEVISAIFTMTPDLTAAFPATAARTNGWGSVPLLCATEIAVPGAMPRCLRVLVHVERVWARPPVHVYLGDAADLRPDLRRPVRRTRSTGAFPISTA